MFNRHFLGSTGLSRAKLHGTFARFVVVGGLTAATYIGLIYVIVEALGFPPFVGVGVAYIIAVTINYWLNYVWTYQSDMPHTQSGTRFVIISLVILVINVGLTAYLPAAFGVSYILVQVIVCISLPALTFLSHITWVFLHRESA
jgi:putative flippase GtrA